MDSLKFILLALTVTIIYVTSRTMNTISKLKHFKPSEFGASLPFLNPELLLKLDNFRERVNSPVYISPASGSLYRPDDLKSQHSDGRAADIFIDSPKSYLELKQLAQESGFSGIGIYPMSRYEKHPSAKMMHLDIRLDRTSDNPALWGMLKNSAGEQYQVSFNEAIRYA